MPASDLSLELFQQIDPAGDNAVVCSQETDYSLTVNCSCGEESEAYGYELEFLRCKSCGQVFYISPFVELVPLDDAQLEQLSAERLPVVTTV